MGGRGAGRAPPVLDLPRYVGRGFPLPRRPVPPLALPRQEQSMSSGTGDLDRLHPSGEPPEGLTRRVGRRGHSSRGSRRTGATAQSLRLPEVGERLFGFRLRGELGRGAFARVFLAGQADLAGRAVVVKISSIDGDEPQTLAQLQHTHIVPIYSVHEDSRAGLRAVCMPYFGGAAFSVVLQRLWEQCERPQQGAELIHALRGVMNPAVSYEDRDRLLEGETGMALRTGPTPLDLLGEMSYLRAVAWIILHLAEALQHAHQRGVVHRDVKPSNILIGSDGQPLLLDFNVAKNLRRVDAEVRATVGGTIAYMAPEHLKAMSGQGPVDDVDQRSDIYSLGIVFYEAMTGCKPFEQTGSYSPVLSQVTLMALERS